MSEELKNVVAEAVETVDETEVVEKVAKALELSNVEAAGIGLGLFVAGVLAKMGFDAIKKRIDRKAEQDELEKKGFFGKLFHKGKKAVEAAQDKLEELETDETPEE